MTTETQQFTIDTTASEQPSLRPLFDGSGKFRGLRRGRALITGLDPLFEAASDASTTEFVDSTGNIFSSTVPVTREQFAITAHQSRNTISPQACRHGKDCRGRPEQKGYCVMSHGNNVWCDHDFGHCTSASCKKAHFSSDFAKKEEKRKNVARKPTAAEVVAKVSKRKPQPKSKSIDPTPAEAAELKTPTHKSVERKTPKHKSAERKPVAKPTAAEVVARSTPTKNVAAEEKTHSKCHFKPCRNTTCPKSHAEGQHQPDDTQCFHPSCPDPVCAKTRHHVHKPNLKRAIKCDYGFKCKNRQCPFAHPFTGAPQWCSKYYGECSDKECEGHHWKKGGIAKKAQEPKPVAKPTKKPVAPKVEEFPVLSETTKPSRKPQPAEKTAAEVVKTMADVVSASVAPKPKSQRKPQRKPQQPTKKSDLLMPEGVTIQEVDTTVVTEVKMSAGKKEKKQVPKVVIQEKKQIASGNSFAGLEVEDTSDSNESSAPVAATATVEPVKAKKTKVGLSKKTRRAIEKKEAAATASVTEVGSETPQEDDWFMSNESPKPATAKVTPTWSKVSTPAPPVVEEKPTKMLSLTRSVSKKPAKKSPSRLSLLLKKD